MIDTQLILAHIDKRFDELEVLIKSMKPKRRKPVKNPQKKPYGEFKNVLLTDEEHAALSDKWGDLLAFGIKILDEGIQAKGYKYKDFAMLLDRGWPAERIQEIQDKAAEKQQKRSLWS